MTPEEYFDRTAAWLLDQRARAYGPTAPFTMNLEVRYRDDSGRSSPLGHLGPDYSPAAEQCYLREIMRSEEDGWQTASEEPSEAQLALLALVRSVGLPPTEMSYRLMVLLEWIHDKAPPTLWERWMVRVAKIFWGDKDDGKDETAVPQGFAPVEDAAEDGGDTSEE